MCPISYLLIFDIADIRAADVRHGRKEGRQLKDFRASCRRFFGGVDICLEESFKRLADVWLAFTAHKDSAGNVADDDMDFCIEEALVIHKTMAKRMMSLHADAVQMTPVARKAFLSAGDVLDQRLPKFMQGAAAAAERAEMRHNDKRGRDDDLDCDGGFRHEVGVRQMKVAEGNVWCQACRKELPKTDLTHRVSAEHLEAIAGRK